MIILMADRCPVEKRLADDVAAILTRLVELTTAQLQALQEQREADVSRLDKVL